MKLQACNIGSRYEISTCLEYSTYMSKGLALDDLFILGLISYLLWLGIFSEIEFCICMEDYV